MRITEEGPCLRPDHELDIRRRSRARAVIGAITRHVVHAAIVSVFAS
jgi:hypothetical protein